MRLILYLVLLYCVSHLTFILLKYYTNCDNPMVTILSPRYNKGYLAITSCNNQFKYNIYDIIIYKQPTYLNFFIRRIIEINDDGILTKSDDNVNHDRGLYYNNELYVKKKYIVGRVYTIIPFIGWFKLVCDNYVLFKYIIFILYLLFSIFFKIKRRRYIFLKLINIIFNITIYFIFLLEFSKIGIN